MGGGGGSEWPECDWAGLGGLMMEQEKVTLGLVACDWLCVDG